ncbi:MAG: hypothetical protein J6Y20_12400 [Lachnospiraceae bacterium]|nr:hypothetical protein [Lachnospiraceae bacterium]
MSPVRFNEILKKYRGIKARIAYLRSQIDMHEKFLEMCTKGMIYDMISLSQAITGMPHGTGTGDPTGRLAIDIESGTVSPFVKEIQQQITIENYELNEIIPQARAVEVALGALSDKERDLVTMKIMDEMSWAEVIHKVNSRYGGRDSKRTLQRVLERATQKAYEVVQ